MSKLNFFPFCYPTYENIIELPEVETEYKTVELGEVKKREKDKTVEVNIDMRKLTNNREKSYISYNVKELKNIARTLGIKGSGNMNKENLINYIKLKLKK